MTVMEHEYGVPSKDELARLVGAATPHFSLQIRDRVREYMDALPDDSPRRPELEAHIVRLEALAVEGQMGQAIDRDLPPRPSLHINR